MCSEHQGTFVVCDPINRLSWAGICDMGEHGGSPLLVSVSLASCTDKEQLAKGSAGYCRCVLLVPTLKYEEGRNVSHAVSWPKGVAVKQETVRSGMKVLGRAKC